MQRAQSLQSAASSDGDGLRGGDSAELLTSLPESPVFAVAAKFFAQPLNDREVRAWLTICFCIFWAGRLGLARTQSRVSPDV